MVVGKVDHSKPYAYLGMEDSNREDLLGKPLQFEFDNIISVDVSTENNSYVGASGTLVIHAKTQDGSEFGILFNSPDGKLPTISDIQKVTGQSVVWDISN